MRNRLRRLRGDGGWFWITSLLIVPAAVLGIAFGIFCIWLAVAI